MDRVNNNKCGFKMSSLCSIIFEKTQEIIGFIFLGLSLVSLSSVAAELRKEVRFLKYSLNDYIVWQRFGKRKRDEYCWVCFTIFLKKKKISEATGAGAKTVEPKNLKVLRY